MTLVSTTDAAKLFGVSRQAIDQGLARAADPPQPYTSAGPYRFYDLDEISAWWQRRAEDRIKERRLKPIGGPTTQCNFRCTAEDYAFITSIAEPGQSVASVARTLIMEAIAARKQAAKDGSCAL